MSSSSPGSVPDFKPTPNSRDRRPMVTGVPHVNSRCSDEIAPFRTKQDGGVETESYLSRRR
jgi:hypothetical protein